MAASPISEDMLELWHRRLGHPAYATVQRMASEGLVTGIKLPPSLLTKKPQQCECCILGKQPHLPHPRSTSTTDRPLELLHADISGPFEYESNGGHVYYMALIDDFSRFCTVSPIKTKDEAKHVLVKTMKEWAVQLDVNVKRLRTDGGTEFINSVVDGYCCDNGPTI
jgi:hypothetical protein